MLSSLYSPFVQELIKTFIPNYVASLTSWSEAGEDENKLEVSFDQFKVVHIPWIGIQMAIIMSKSWVV